MATILPGILLTVLFMITLAILSWINPNAAPARPRTSLKEKVASLRYTWSVLFLFLLVIGGSQLERKKVPFLLLIDEEVQHDEY